MFNKTLVFPGFLILAIVVLLLDAKALGEKGFRASLGPLVVRKEDRRPVVSTEYGEISAVQISDNINGSYLLHFFDLEPNTVFLPVVLHADMVFYVRTGNGKLSWAEDDDELIKREDLKRGDVYRLKQGTVFFIQSNIENDQTEQQNLRIHAIFANSNDDLQEPAAGPYSSIRDMVVGFDKKILQATFGVPEEVIDELLSSTTPLAIVHGKTERADLEIEAQLDRGLLVSKRYDMFELNKKKKEKKEKEKVKTKTRLFNLLEEEKDFENCNGWSTSVSRNKLSALEGSDFGLFMVNLKTGSMVGPHWNPLVANVAVVLQGRGMVRSVCSSSTISNKKAACKNTRFEVEEGDVFIVPRFHSVAQMSFNDDTFVFMGFSSSSSTMKNPLRFLAGKASVLQTLDRDVLALSFNVTNTTLGQLLAAQDDRVILGCTSCAEEELRKLYEEHKGEEEDREGGGGWEESGEAQLKRGF